jgi:hypothetical protein
MLETTKTIEVKQTVIDPEIAHIQAAIDDYRAGVKTYPHEEVMKQMYEIIEQARLKQVQ